jgi:intracellular sulfur oxidation DsrE/DsrF family protein
MATPTFVVTALLLLPVALAHGAESHWPAASSPAIPDADGYAVIPHAAVAPSRSHVYKAIFDATQAAADPGKLVPALNMAGSELNALAASAVPLSHAHFAVVFHGAAMSAILRDESYKGKFGVANPNLDTLRKMKAAGVEFFVCGQNLVADNVDPATLIAEVTVASDALVVLMTYQNNGYALLSF